jgi:rubrerythrin
MAQLTEIVKDYFTNAVVDRFALMDTLSEFLAVELGGAKLYEKALTLVTDSQTKSAFREFLKQTLNHQKVLTRMITQLGGNPKTQSDTAKIAAEKAQALMRTMGRRELSKEQNQLNAIENIVLAETKDHGDWELLAKIARQTTDKQLREVLEPAVKTVEQEEDEHLNWTRKKLSELQMESLTQEAESGSGRGPASGSDSKSPKRSKSSGKSRTKSKPDHHASRNGRSHE